jgi:hypothetical protein
MIHLSDELDPVLKTENSPSPWAISPVDLAGDMSTKKNVRIYVDCTVLYECSSHIYRTNFHSHFCGDLHHDHVRD